MLSLVFAVIIQMRSDSGSQVTLVLAVVLIPTPRIDFTPLLPEFCKQTFFSQMKVKSKTCQIQ